MKTRKSMIVRYALFVISLSVALFIFQNCSQKNYFQNLSSESSIDWTDLPTTLKINSIAQSIDFQNVCLGQTPYVEMNWTLLQDEKSIFSGTSPCEGPNLKISSSGLSTAPCGTPLRLLMKERQGGHMQTVDFTIACHTGHLRSADAVTVSQDDAQEIYVCRYSDDLAHPGSCLAQCFKNGRPFDSFTATKGYCNSSTR